MDLQFLKLFSSKSFFIFLVSANQILQFPFGIIYLKSEVLFKIMAFV